MHRQKVIAAMPVLLALVLQTANADEAKRKYPAQICVISQKTDDAGRLSVRLRLLIDDDVAIYANPVGAPGMDHPSARVTVLDANEQPLRAKVTYPKGDKLETEFQGDWYLYRKSADIEVTLPDNPPRPLFFRAKIAGYNERRACCLGFGSLETKLTTTEHKTTEQ